jgi:hypothetical protein
MSMFRLALACGLFAFALATAAHGQAAAPQLKLSLFGPGPGSEFGQAVAGLGDTTGDGAPELVVGAPGASPLGASGAGEARVYSARTGRLLFVLAGPEDDAAHGAAVAGVGDADGDAVPDFIVGAENASVAGAGHAGRAFVYSGKSGALIFAADGELADSAYGSAVSGAGDVNGDGLADVIVGAPHMSPFIFDFGEAYVHSAPAGTLELDVSGMQSFEFLGWSVAGAGDIDQDGYDDVAVAAFGAETVSVYSVEKQLLLTQIQGSALGASFLGTALASAGDLDGDGIPELLLGASSPTGGKVFAYSVATSSVLHTWTEPSGDLQFGAAVASAGDVDGDGTLDVIVGLPQAPPLGTPGPGSVRVYSGQTGALLFAFEGVAVGDRLGAAVGSAGDVDGDGRAEVVVGSPGADRGSQQDVGRVLVLGL